MKVHQFVTVSAALSLLSLPAFAATRPAIAVTKAAKPGALTAGARVGATKKRGSNLTEQAGTALGLAGAAATGVVVAAGAGAFDHDHVSP